MPFHARILEQAEKFGPGAELSSHVPGKAQQAATTLVYGNCIRSCPPFLLAELKKMLADFNAAKMEWRKP